MIVALNLVSVKRIMMTSPALLNRDNMRTKGILVCLPSCKLVFFIIRQLVKIIPF